MLHRKLWMFAQDETGATSIEYALIAGIVSIAIVGALTGIKNSLGDSFGAVVSGFSQKNP